MDKVALGMEGEIGVWVLIGLREAVKVSKAANGCGTVAAGMSTSWVGRVGGRVRGTIVGLQVGYGLELLGS